MVVVGRGVCGGVWAGVDAAVDVSGVFKVDAAVDVEGVAGWEALDVSPIGPRTLSLSFCAPDAFAAPELAAADPCRGSALADADDVEVPAPSDCEAKSRAGAIP